MKAGIVSCSNWQSLEWTETINELRAVLKDMGINACAGEHIYAGDGQVAAGTPKERAADLMAFFKDREITDIFDISGGDVANEILPYLDYEAVKASQAMFWGYSDLTALINAICAKTQRPSILYQIKNLVWESGDIQRDRFRNFISLDKSRDCDLFDFRYEFLQGEEMHGLTVGGNVRCLLKLAGTSYWPEMDERVLVLEALGGSETQIRTYFSQLDQMGVFSRVRGILLGTFTKLEETKGALAAYELLRPHISEKLPVAGTPDIGHGKDARAVVIGDEIHLYREECPAGV